MSIRFLMITGLGLAAMIVPARASFSFLSDQSSFDTAVTAGGLTGSSITNFNLVGTGFQYTDITTGVIFEAFSSNGVTHDTFTGSGTAIKTSTTGDFVRITLPANVLAFGGDFTTSSTFASPCFDPETTIANCSDNNDPHFINKNQIVFLGFSSAAAFTTIWVGQPSGSTSLQINDFEIGTGGGSATPEIATWMAIATGLMLLGVARRRVRLAVRCG